MDNRPKPHIVTAELVNAYRAGASLEDIASAVRMTSGGVRHRLLKAGITMRARNHGQLPSNRKPISTDLLIARYHAGAPAHQIAREVGLSTRAVFDRLKRRGVTSRKRSDYPGATGMANPNWHGGRFEREDGYVLVRDGGRYIFEHRFVVQRALGRMLKAKEHVHHINGIRNDNRLENLTVTHPTTHESRTLIKALQKRIRELEALIQRDSSERAQA